MLSSRINYSHTIGIASFEGRGFMNPIELKFHNEILYVLSRSNGSNKNNRISAVSLDSEHKFEFANWGEENGKSILPTSIAIDHKNQIFLRFNILVKEPITYVKAQTLKIDLHDE